MFKKKSNLTYGEMKELRKKHEKVSTEVFIQLSETEKELIFRKELVKQYGRYCNVTFFSDGSVHMKSTGKGAAGWILTPHPSHPSSDTWAAPKKPKKVSYGSADGATPPY